jgi:transposase
MSNVTLQEIAECCAREFGVDVAALQLRADRHVKEAPGQVARDCYIWLASIHTRADTLAIAEQISFSRDRVRDIRSRMGDRMTWDKRRRARLERIEEEIDRIHEARCATVDALRSAVRVAA